MVLEPAFKYIAPPFEPSKKPEPLVLFTKAQLEIVHTPLEAVAYIPEPKTPKLLPPAKKELPSIIQLLNNDEQLLFITPAPNASSF